MKRKAELLVQRLNHKEDDKLILTAKVEESSVEEEQDASDEESDDLYATLSDEKSSEESIKYMTNERNEKVNKKQLPVRKSNRESKKPGYLDDYDCHFVEKMCFIAETESSLSFKQIMMSKYADQWRKAMDKEIKSLNENNTWELVDMPENKKLVHNRWVFRIKTKANGSLDRFKARLVAKEYSQRQGVDYEETFSPVVRYETVRAILSVTATENLQLLQFDVKTAFLYGNLTEEVYMKQPEGYSDGSDRVCKLNRSLYGLKQAPRCWNQRFVNFIKQYSLKQSMADPCLFTRTRNNNKLLVIIYVDDGLIAGSNQEEIQVFIRELKQEFKITVGPPESFLGIHILRQKDRSIFLTQRIYSEKILDKFRMSEAKPVSTPSEGIIQKNDTEEVFDKKIPYRQAVGSLMYLTSATRPDLMYAVSAVSEKLDSPTLNSWNAVRRIYKYLRGTTDYGLFYKATTHEELRVYSDSDFAGDVTIRRSRTGVISMLSGAAISWTSRKQQCYNFDNGSRVCRCL